MFVYSLIVVLKRSMVFLLVDDCPQRFLDGRDPYMKSTMVYIISSAPTFASNIVMTFSAVLLQKAFACLIGG